ncbi:MAG: carbohydrate ABC transporter permease, partial [Thermotogae bacterium]
MKRKTPIWAFILAIFLILIFNLPFINVVMTSLKTTADISKSPPPLIFRPTLKHYRNIFTNPTFSFLNFLVNSSVIALSSAVFSILLCLPASYAMVRYGIGRKFIFPFSVSLRAIPLIIFAVPIYILFKSVGLIDTRLGIVIIHTLVDIPLALMLLVNFIQDIPREIEEAARIDGASDL